MDKHATFTEVRYALQCLAHKKGRPDYEMYVAKQVKHAIDNNLDHPLLNELLIGERKPIELPKPKKPTTGDEFVEIRRWLLSIKMPVREIAFRSGCSITTISSIRTGATVKISPPIKEKLDRFRSELSGEWYEAN